MNAHSPFAKAAGTNPTKFVVVASLIHNTISVFSGADKYKRLADVLMMMMMVMCANRSTDES